MSETITLKVAKREERGKGENHRLRAAGFVPGIFYDKSENIAVKSAHLPLEKAYAKVGTSQLLTLDIDGDARPVIIKELVKHPYKNRIDHVDFYGVDMAKTVRVQVPVETTGKPKGLDFGGVLTIFRDHLEVECLPADIPSSLTIDVSGLDLNENVAVDEVPTPDGVTVLFDEHFAVVGLVAKAEEAGEGEEGAAEADEAAEEAE
ncbi:50S ribosomal protein L25 [Desulfocurvus sp. DL9XJH121]